MLIFRGAEIRLNWLWFAVMMNVSPYAPWMEDMHLDLDNHRFKPNGGTYLNTCYAAYGSRFCWVVWGDFLRIRSYGMKITIELTLVIFLSNHLSKSKKRGWFRWVSDEFPFQFGWIFRFQRVHPGTYRTWSGIWGNLLTDECPFFVGRYMVFKVEGPSTSPLGKIGSESDPKKNPRSKIPQKFIEIQRQQVTIIQFSSFLHMLVQLIRWIYVCIILWYTPKKFNIFNKKPEKLNPQKKEIPNLEITIFRCDSFNFRGGVSWWLSKSCSTEDVWNHYETLQIMG